jgi:hypothetical protein
MPMFSICVAFEHRQSTRRNQRAQSLFIRIQSTKLDSIPPAWLKIKTKTSFVKNAQYDLKPAKKPALNLAHIVDSSNHTVLFLNTIQRPGADIHQFQNTFAPVRMKVSTSIFVALPAMIAKSIIGLQAMRMVNKASSL